MKLVATQHVNERESDALDGFGTEAALRSPAPQAVRGARRVIAWVLTVSVLLTSAALAAARGVLPLPVRTASISIDSTPSGAEVFIAGAPAGRTPLTVSLAPGQYVADVRNAGEQVSLQIAATRGAVVSHHVRFAAPPPVAPAPTASLVVTTEPAQLRVSVDGVDRGASPVRLTGLAAGAHKVRVVSATGNVDRDLALTNGESLSVVIVARATGEAGPSTGWLSTSSAVPLRIVENGRALGTSNAAVVLSAGVHDIELVNDDLGFREQRRVTVAGGKTTPVRIDVPRGQVSINAVPWADVWVDGEHVGETPIGNYAVSIGVHQVVFRHPQLGERRERAVVTTRSVARVAVNYGNR